MFPVAITICFFHPTVIPDIVKEVMETVYFEFGLCLTFSNEKPDADFDTKYDEDYEDVSDSKLSI